MGQLQDGQWVTDDLLKESVEKGEFRRKESSFREWIRPRTRFSPEDKRYHLYVSYACPWAHRTLLFRKLKRLEEVISLTVVSPDIIDFGWSFKGDYPETILDEINHKEYLKDIYLLAAPKCSSRVTVPVLWDKKEKTIVNNESSEIIQMLNSSFDSITGNDLDFFPSEFQDQIEDWNQKIYNNVNNGVYKTGFATTQEAYEKNCEKLFETLQEIETHLEGREFFVGNRPTAVDLRLFPTLIRFDLVYFVHFKCNVKRIIDFPNLHKYLKIILNLEGVSETVNFFHIKRHYYYSHKSINPFRIIPSGPSIIV